MKTIKTLIRRMRNTFASHFLYSFKSTILSLYIPIIIIFIFITGMASYFLATAQIEENAYRNIKNIVFQTGNYLDNRFTDALQQLQALSNDPDIFTIINKKPEDISPDDYLRVQAHVNTIRSFNGALIDCIYINFNDGNFVFSRGYDASAMAKIGYWQYRMSYNNYPDDIYWQNFCPEDLSGEKRPSRDINMFKLFGRDNAEIKGIILFNLRYEFFEKVFNRSLLIQNGYLMLISQEGVMTFKNVNKEYQINDETLKYLQKTKEKEGKCEFITPQGKKMVVIYETLQTNQWKLAAVFTEEEILEKVNYIKYITFGVTILLIIVAVILTNALASYITKPISVLADSMERIKGENIDFVSTAHPFNEMEVLNQGVKELVERVKILLEQINMEQEIKRQLEFSVIQTQINPHFLYNTLYSIKGLCDMGMNAEASAMVTALANFFRISISCGEEIISIEEELSHIQNYLFIQEMRYGDDFSYEINIAPDILSYSIVKLTLQPLVENAIYHGVKQKRGTGWIKVSGYEQDGFLHFEVQDNGLGMSSERLTEIRKSLKNREFGLGKIGLGVRSVHERIRLHYGPEAKFTIDSQLNEGTVVKVIIPAKQQGASNNA